MPDMMPDPSLRDKWGELLVKHGFIVKEDEKGRDVRGLYKYDPLTKLFMRGDGGRINPHHALMEHSEETLINTPHQEGGTEYIPTGYPSPIKRYRHWYETFSLSIEEVYFWLVEEIRFAQGWTRAYKIKDIFTATENSAFFGTSQQRLGIQQDRVSQYLASIGKMTKDLFQLVREMRILDEKLHPRHDWKVAKSADITLKAEYIDLVENRGGQTNPGSVYGMAQQLGYAALPDLFFNTRVYKLEEVDRVVDKLEFNKSIKTTLKRKLYQFVNWKLKTDHELEARRRFTLKYLRQHWDVIEMYMSWIKPYLRHIARLQMNDDKLDSIDLIGAFEQSFIETEILFAKPQANGSKLLETLLLTVNYRTRPHMSFVQDGYQKGPVHVGVAEITYRGYMWTEQHIEMYKRYRQQEDLYMIGVVDKSVQSAMDALGEELEEYLAEAGEPKYREKQEEKDRIRREHEKANTSTSGMFSGILDPFTAIFTGFGDMFQFGGFSRKTKSSVKWNGFAEGYARGKLSANFKTTLYQTQKNFKASHGMLSWG